MSVSSPISIPFCDSETKEVFKSIQADPVVRAVVLSGRGETFSSGRSVTPLFPFSGMDLDEFPRVMAEVAHRDSSRCGLKLRRFIEEMQEVFSSLESVCLSVSVYSYFLMAVCQADYHCYSGWLYRGGG